MQQKLLKANEFIKNNAPLVNPEYRNKFHLMAPIGWINDPNGFVYYQGEYHLFYQYYPYDSIWGPMHWGHAKSKDLIHWEHLPVALAPGESYDKDGCFSGSAIEKDGKLYLIYTGHNVVDGQVRQVQCLAVSEDGVHFEKYAGNPIIAEDQIASVATTEDFRDPKVFQRQEDYFTVVATKTSDDRGQIVMFHSKDLLTWEFYSVLLEGTPEQGIVWECPDLFEIDGKEVLILSPIQMLAQGNSYQNTNSTVAFVGTVDWQAGKFQVENFHEIDGGLDFYAPQTCENEAGQRIMTAWMQMWQRKMPTNDLGHGWSGSMTLPRELRVADNQLLQRPISTIYQVIDEQESIKGAKTEENLFLLKDLVYDQHYLRLEINLKMATKLELQYAKGAEHTLLLSYDVAQECFTVSREQMPYDLPGAESEVLKERSVTTPLENNYLTVEIFRDTSAIEIFLNDRLTMSTTFYETEKGHDFLLQADSEVTFSLESGLINL